MSAVTLAKITMACCTFSFHSVIKNLFYTFRYKTTEEFLIWVCIYIGALTFGIGVAIIIQVNLGFTPDYLPSADINELTASCVELHPTFNAEQLAEQLDKDVIEVKNQDQEYFKKNMLIWAGTTIVVLVVFCYFAV